MTLTYQPYLSRLILFASIASILLSGCKKEEYRELPGLYEMGLSTGDGFVKFDWYYPALENEKYGIKLTCISNDERHTKSNFGGWSITIDSLENGREYEVQYVRFDGDGNRSEPITFSDKIIPNTPFIMLSPENESDYTIVDNKLNIDIRFNRPADTSIDFRIFEMFYVLKLKNGSTDIPYSYRWTENNEVLSLVTEEEVDAFCESYPCSLDLKIRFEWIGSMYYEGFRDTNEMLLDLDRDGFEMGDSTYHLVIEP